MLDDEERPATSQEESLHPALMIPCMAMLVLGFIKGVDMSFMSSPPWGLVMFITVLASGLCLGFLNAWSERDKGYWGTHFVAGLLTGPFIFGMFFGIGRLIAHVFG